MLLALAAAVYSVIQFGPVYYRKWKAKGVLSDAVSRAYPRRHSLQTPEGMQFLSKLQDETVQKLRQLGIQDGGMYVRVEKTGKEIRAQAVYTEIVRHPLVNKSTTLHFRPSNSHPLRPSDD
jgi:hypothetical protein